MVGKMNERFREFALESRIAYYSKNGSYEWSDDGFSVIPSTQSLEKFAELIVQECAEIGYDTYWNDPEGVRGITIKQRIKEHFQL